MGETPHGRPAARTTATFVGGLVVVFGVLQVVQQVASAFDPRPIITASLTVGIALLGALVAHWQSRASAAKEQAQLHRLLAVHPDEQPGTADAVALGVFPGTRVRGRTPPYVSREIDAKLRAAITAGTSVVVVGPPRAGKSRTALEAVRAAASGAAIISPRGPDELRALLAADPHLRVARARRILWLDDLPQYVESLDQPALDRLPSYFPPPERSEHDELSVVATVREEEWLAMLAASGSAGQLARGLADRAEVYRLTPSDPVFEARAGSIYPSVAFPRGPGEALASSGMEAEMPERPAPPFVPADPGRWDWTARVLAAGAGIAGIVTAVVLVVWGFSTPTPPPMAAQIAAIERRAAKHGQYVRQAVGTALDLHGSGQASRLFVVSDSEVRRGEPAPSDELRIYDEHDGWLRRAFRFKPAEPGVKFDFRAARDIDGDGAVEVVGGYAAPDARNAVLPLAIEWQGFAQRYAIVPLDLGPPPLSTAKLPDRFQVQARLYREKYDAAFTIRDASSSRRVTGHRVQEFVIATPLRIVAAYFLRPPFDLAKDPALYELHAAILKVGRSPSLTRCELVGIPRPKMEILLSERSQRHALAETWQRATANRYCRVAGS
jgi:hypothetical protein